ncbi:hypothetical protein, partial [Thiolapillus sp.]
MQVRYCISMYFKASSIPKKKPLTVEVNGFFFVLERGVHIKDAALVCLGDHPGRIAPILTWKGPPVRP